MVQTIIFTILIILMFIYTFVRLVKRNNTNYIYLLVIQFIAIIIDFFHLVKGQAVSSFLLILLYIVAVVLPIIYFILEKHNLYIDEIINIMKAKKSPSEAKSLLLKNIEKYPESYVSHKMLAELYNKNNEKEKAEDEYMQVISIKPKDYDSYCRLATIFHENKKDEDAKAVLQDLLNAKPDYYEGSKLLGNILYENEQFKEAILVYNEALKYNPGEYELYYFIGMTYTRLNDFQNAREYYKKAATLNSIKDVVNLNLGQICLIFREYDEAEKYFQEEINSEDERVQANAYLYLAKIKLIKKDTDSAIMYANLAIEIDPKIIRKIENDYMLAIILGKLKLATGKEVKTKLTKKEEQIIEHLGKTYNVVENLTDNVTTQEYERER